MKSSNGAKIVIGALVVYILGVIVGARIGNIERYHQALKDVSEDGLEFTVRCWNKQHPDWPIVLTKHN